MRRRDAIPSLYPKLDATTIAVPAAVVLVSILAAFGALAETASGYRPGVEQISYRGDAFVRYIESRIVGSAHVQITPGITMTDPGCGCTVRYLGTKVTGHIYAVYFDKLD